MIGSRSEWTPKWWSLLILIALGVAIAVASFRWPLPMLMALVGLFAIAVCIVSRELSLLLLMGVIPLEYAFKVSDNPQITTVKLAGAMCFASFAFNALRTRRPIRVDWTHVALLIFLALGVLSAFQARSTAAAWAPIQRYASFIALYFVVSQLSWEHQLQRRIAWMLSIASSIAAVLAAQDLLAGHTLRAMPKYGDANDFAFILASTLPLTLWLLRSRGYRRVIVVIMIGLIAAGILLSFSRGALFALAVGFLLHALSQRRQIPALVFAAVIAGATTVAFVQSNPETVAVGIAAKSQTADVNVESRLRAWNQAMELAITHPIAGIGPGNFQFYSLDATADLQAQFQATVVHDAYLDVAAELGLIGLALWIAYLTASILRLSDSVRHGRGPPQFAAAVRTALIVALLGGITLSEQYVAPLWVLGGLATALWREGHAPDLNGFRS